MQRGNPLYLDLRHDDANRLIADERQSSWGSSYEQIWRIICNANLKLEETTAYVTPSAFMEYIGSYSGLKKLNIATGRFRDRVASNSAAKKLCEALEKHADSIEELDVDAEYEGSWCFGHHNKALFSTFQNLTTLGVKVQSSEFIGSSEPGDASSQDIIVSSPSQGSTDLTDVEIESPDCCLIDTTVIYMPQLQALSVSIADSERSRDNMCGKITFSHYLCYERKIIARVPKYEAALGCKRPPMFITRTFPWSRSARVFVSRSPPDLLHKSGKVAV